MDPILPKGSAERLSALHVKSLRVRDMCEGVVYVLRDGDKSRIMEEVVYLEIRPGETTIVNEDGERRTLSGFKQVRVDMIRHEVLIVY